MQRGVCALTRRTPIPQSFSATVLCRADDKKGGASRKKLKPHQKYKGERGSLTALTQASNLWKFAWFKDYPSLPEELKRNAMYIPYYNASVRYNPNDPAETRRYLNNRRSKKLKEKNENMSETKGVRKKEWKPDERLINNDDMVDEDADDGDDFDEEYEVDEDEVEWRDVVERGERESARKQFQASRRAVIVDGMKQRIRDFEAMSEKDKVKKMIEVRAQMRETYKKYQEMEKRVDAMTEEEALVALKKEFGMSGEEEEQVLRGLENVRNKTPNMQKSRDFRRKYKIGEYAVKGQLSDLDIYLKDQGKPYLIGFIEKHVLSEEDPKLPPPVDLSLLDEPRRDEPERKEKKTKA